MVELIITGRNGIDRESIADYKLDAAWGADENDFELTVDRLIDAGSYVYFDGSECGGIVDALKDNLKRGESTLTYSGRTWHGMLADKILEPDKGKDYLTVSGTASSVIGSLISRVGLDAVFDAVDTLRLCLTPFIPMLKTMRVLKENMRAAAAKGFINATDCADYLVASKGLPFRDAYKITGELVALCIERGLTLETLPIDEYKKVCNAFDEGVYEAINLEKCVRDRKVKGAPCPENVRAAAKEVRTIVNGL